MIDSIRKYPVLWLAAVEAAVVLVVAFGLDLSAEQIGAVSAFAAAVLGLVAHRRVTPVEPDDVGW